METTTTETKSPRCLTRAARAAGDIRRVLKAAFPEIKFRVTSDNFSMGDSVDVRWVDGPTPDAVEMLVARFKDGHFDGSIDMYESADADATTPNRAKFVSCDRKVSPAIRTALEADIAKAFTPGSLSDMDASDLAYRILRKADLSGGYLALHHGDAGWEIIEERPIARAREAA